MSRPAIVVASALVALCAACSVDRPPDIVVVTLDTLRADRLGSYGNPDGLTPALDRFALGATLFESAVAPAPITLPSHASLFTGRYPASTGVRNNGTFVLPASERTLAEVLREAGWATAAVVAAHPLNGRYGLAQGFDRYDDAMPEAGDGRGAMEMFFPERDAAAVTERALRLWAGMEGRPRFLWVHYFDTHAPYEPPEPFASLESVSPYDREVAYLDSEVGKLLGAIEASSPRAIVVVLADHGEGLGEHGEDTHGILLYETTLRVPLLIRAPGRLPQGRRVSMPVGLVDVFPTVLGLLELPVPDGIEGTDLRAAVGGSGAPRALYAESYLPLLDYRFSPLAMIRDGDLKYIDSPGPELFDLGVDPTESHNLHGRHPQEARLAGELAGLRARADAEASERAGAALDPESAERLRALGYVGGGATSIESSSVGRDPKTMLDYVRREDEAVNLIAAGRIDPGLATLRELIAEVPENYVGRFRLGAVLLAVGRDEEAGRELDAVVAADPAFYPGHQALGEARGRLGRLDEAVESYTRAAELAPALAEPCVELARLLDSYGRFEEAAAAYVAALSREPDDLRIVRELTDLRAGRGEPERAASEIEALARQHPGSAALWTGLAELSLRLGRLEEAKAAVEQALVADPFGRDASLAEGELRLAQGRGALAEPSFRRLVAVSPTDSAARFGLARSLLAQERLREAEVELVRVLEIDPSFGAAHTVRGRYLEARGDARAAAEAYQRALRLDPRDPEAKAGLERVARVP